MEEGTSSDPVKVAVLGDAGVGEPRLVVCADAGEDWIVGAGLLGCCCPGKSSFIEFAVSGLADAQYKRECVCVQRVVLLTRAGPRSHEHNDCHAGAAPRRVGPCKAIGCEHVGRWFYCLHGLGQRGSAWEPCPRDAVG
jgi:hypothetical protein